MRRLRQKLEVEPNQPAHLLTVRGVGYRLVSRTSDAAGAPASDVASAEPSGAAG
jgi:hypothetical protein